MLAGDRARQRRLRAAPRPTSKKPIEPNSNSTRRDQANLTKPLNERAFGVCVLIWSPLQVGCALVLRRRRMDLAHGFAGLRPSLLTLGLCGGPIESISARVSSLEPRARTTNASHRIASQRRRITLNGFDAIRCDASGLFCYEANSDFDSHKSVMNQIRAYLHIRAS